LITTGIVDAAIELGGNEVLGRVEDVGFAEEAGCFEELGFEEDGFEVAGLEVIFNDVANEPECAEDTGLEDTYKDGATKYDLFEELGLEMVCVSERVVECGRNAEVGLREDCDEGGIFYDNGAKTEKEDGTEGSSLNEEKLVIKKTWL
jgi:hypothetical protein